MVTSASRPIALAISACRDNSEYHSLYDCTLCGVMTTFTIPVTFSLGVRFSPSNFPTACEIRLMVNDS